MHYIPNIIITTFNRTDIYMHECLSCKSRFFPENVTDVVCEICAIPDSVPAFNQSPVQYRGNIIRYEIEIPARMRRSRYNYRKVFARDLYICQYCGATPILCIDEVPLTIDHITPHISGGSNKMENLKTCCNTCNILASSKIFDTFLDKKIYIHEARKRKNLQVSSYSETVQTFKDNADLVLRMLHIMTHRAYHKTYLMSNPLYQTLAQLV